jgi:hypothetical protein
VSARIKALQSRIDDAVVHTGASLRSHIQRQLYHMATEGETEQTQLRALELMGKLATVQAFVERTVDVTEEMTAEQVEQEIVAKLKQAFNE